MSEPYFIFEVTTKCNLNCEYCYNVWKNNKAYKQGELSFAKIKILFDKLFNEIKPKGITLAGGEPLMHPEIFEIVDFLNSKKIRTCLATNGVLLNEEKIEKLSSLGLKHYEMSLDSIDQNIYKKLTGSKNSNKTKEVISLLRKNKADITVAIIISKENILTLEDTIKLCFAFGATRIALNRFVSCDANSGYQSELKVTNKDLEKALKIADKLSGELNISISATIPIEPCIINHNKFPNIFFGTCMCGDKKWTIDSFGNLRICEQNPEILGNLYNKSFLELSNNMEVKKFRDNNLFDGCNKCEKIKHCGGGCRFCRD